MADPTYAVFGNADDGKEYSCSKCGASLKESYRTLHTQWHRNLATLNVNLFG